MDDLELKCIDFENKLTEGERLLVILNALKEKINDDIDEIRDEANTEINDYIEGVRGFIISHKKGLKVLTEAKHIVATSEWRDAVLMRDKFTCQKCGSNRHLTVHHIIPKKFQCNLNLNQDVNNGITLCNECHTTWHESHENGAGINIFIKWLNE